MTEEPQNTLEPELRSARTRTHRPDDSAESPGNRRIESIDPRRLLSVASSQCRRHKIAVVALMVIAGALRFGGAARVPWIHDEMQKVNFVEHHISFQPAALQLPVAHRKNPLLSDYMLKVELLLLGRAFDGRFLFICAGLLTLFIVYRLVRENLGKNQAVLALALATFDQYYIGTARLASEEPVLLLFASLVVYCSLAALRTKRKRWIYLAGISFGLGYQAKLTIAFLLPTVFFFLLLHRRHRAWFCSKHLYLAMALALLITLPHLPWLVTNASDEAIFYNNVTDVGVSFRVIFLYFGELVQLAAAHLSFFDWQVDRSGAVGAALALTDRGLRLSTGDPNWEFPGFFWLFALLVVAAAVQAAMSPQRRDPTLRFCLTMLSVYAVCVTMIEGRPVGLVRNSEWASATVIPATVLAAHFLWWTGSTLRHGKSIGVAVFACILVNVFLYLRAPVSYFAATPSARCDVYRYEMRLSHEMGCARRLNATLEAYVKECQ